MNWKRKGRDAYIKSWKKTDNSGVVLRQGHAGETRGGITQITEGMKVHLSKVSGQSGKIT